MLAVFLAMLAGAPALAACEGLAGNYVGVESPDYSSDFSRLEFRAGAAAVGVSLWPQGSAAPRMMNVVIGDKWNPGDGEYTGEKYRAACEGGTLFVEARLAERADSFFYVFYREDGELRLVNAIGDYARMTGRFRLKVSR